MLTINDTSTPPSNFPAPWAIEWGKDNYGYWQMFDIKGVRQVMRWMISGVFLMGSQGYEYQRRDNEKQHKVMIKNGFWLANTACTQELWQTVMGDNPSHLAIKKQNPVNSVSWLDCQKFVEKVNLLLGCEPENKTTVFSLPTEEQWEYACRAGSTTPFNTGEMITTEQANFDGNFPYKFTEMKGVYKDKVLEVLSFQPNAWGLFQMHGNTLEWCLDIYDEDYRGSKVIDLIDSTSLRVLRGGCWFYGAQNLRSAYRDTLPPDHRSESKGLRLAGNFIP